jgi:dihydroorotate dehydrogenase
MYRWVRPLLFRLHAEKAHHLGLRGLEWGLHLPGVRQSLRHSPETGQEVSLFGLRFPNRVGLAAGFDKNALHLPALAALGFGHIEIGTATPRPQPGNPKPRLFRLTRDQALINRMGFNNDGAEVIAERIRRHRPPHLVLGGNIGKNKDTPPEHAIEDYLRAFELLAPVVDYITVNVSSPNTPGLRDLQQESFLGPLFETLQTRNQEYQRPILLKLAPELSHEQLKALARNSAEWGLSALIATNTTVERPNSLEAEPEVIASIGKGGLSGLPLRQRANAILEQLRAEAPSGVVLVASGGIMTFQDAEARRKAGAELVQLWTGFVYRGPELVQSIADRLG